VTSADWDSGTGNWTVRMQDEAGGEQALSARFLFLASVYYDCDEPHDARIPGLDSFSGAVIHPQFWPQDADYRDKKVIVIGSGATAATLVPALAAKAAKVTMLQRTPTWYLTLPAEDRAAAWLRRLLPAKAAYALTRLKNIRMQDVLFSKSRNEPEGMKGFLRKQLKEQLGEHYDRVHFTPPYGPWEQRMCLIPDGDLFAALRSGKAEMVTGQIDHVDAHGIVLADGRQLDADVIVTATGLKVVLAGNIALSVDGTPVSIADHFYYRACMFSNLPNLAGVFGYLNASWTLRVDLVGEWLCRLLRHMDAIGADVVTP
jgi:cation diffusion facilitator CzcD-associated flavoprotein CzcO